MSSSSSVQQSSGPAGRSPTEAGAEPRQQLEAVGRDSDQILRERGAHPEELREHRSTLDRHQEVIFSRIAI